jgi:hypothetical protein
MLAPRHFNGGCSLVTGCIVLEDLDHSDTARFLASQNATLTTTAIFGLSVAS